MKSPFKINRCPHASIRGIYGDEINRTPGYRRLMCRDCGRLLDGPVSLAAADHQEKIMTDKLENIERIEQLHRAHYDEGYEDEPYCKTCANQFEPGESLTYQAYPCETAEILKELGIGV